MSESTPSKSTNARMPSLNQLAARMNPNHQPNTASPSPARPRLAASLLRTGSNASLSTAASTADSMAVNAPSTRSASPLLTPPQSTTPSQESVKLFEGANGGGDPLTSERLEKLNEQEGDATISGAESKKRAPIGYKNVPSLEAITARMAMTRQLSIDGSSKPPDAEMIEDPKTPGLVMKAPEHPLQYTWTLYHDTKSKFPLPNAPPDTPFVPPPDTATHEYEAGLAVIGEFDTVESFCRYFNWLKPPSKLERNSNYHLFKAGIKPMWEDPANSQGGKWVLTMKGNPALLDRCWNWLAMALVGEELEEGDEICGAVVSLRAKVDRIQVWTRSKDDVERLNSIGKKLVKLLDVSEADGIGLEFQYNTDDRPLPNKFLSIQAVPSSSYRSSFSGPKSAQSPTTAMEAASPAPSSAGPGSFGGFGTGVGIGGSVWRTSKRT